MQVLRTICSLDFLWKRIRVAGGAYGAMAGLFRNGNAYFVSYRDPNLEETLNVYDELADYIESFKVNEREITKYIIGTMSRVDAPLTPSMKGEKADAHYLSGTTYEDEIKERKEIIETTAEEIRRYGNMVRLMMADNIYCVMGNETRINDAGSLFDHILHVNR
jgi:Zn-dependent M16 (insulinase) family peptidase